MSGGNVFTRELRRLLLVRATVMTLMGGFGTAAAAEPLLDIYRWQNRLLLAFSPSGDDGRLADVQALAHTHAYEFRERDLILGTVLNGEGILEERDLETDEANRLRERYDVHPREFVVLLVGKDGGVKLRVNRPPAPAEVFDLIDAMPMRQLEMRESGG